MIRAYTALFMGIVFCTSISWGMDGDGNSPRGTTVLWKNLKNGLETAIQKQYQQDLKAKDEIISAKQQEINSLNSQIEMLTREKKGFADSCLRWKCGTFTGWLFGAATIAYLTFFCADTSDLLITGTYISAPFAAEPMKDHLSIEDFPISFFEMYATQLEC